MPEDKTSQFVRRTRLPSHIFNVSVRGWLAILIIGTACLDAIATILGCVSVLIWTGSVVVFENKHLLDVNRGIMELALVALGYYFGKEEREHLSAKPDAVLRSDDEKTVKN